jgi:hypothetical protein
MANPSPVSNYDFRFEHPVWPEGQCCAASCPVWVDPQHPVIGRGIRPQHIHQQALCLVGLRAPQGTQDEHRRLCPIQLLLRRTESERTTRERDTETEGSRVSVHDIGRPRHSSGSRAEEGCEPATVGWVVMLASPRPRRVQGAAVASALVAAPAVQTCAPTRHARIESGRRSSLQLVAAQTSDWQPPTPCATAPPARDCCMHQNRTGSGSRCPVPAWLCRILSADGAGIRPESRSTLLRGKIR